MLKFKHSTLIILAGLIWLSIGIFLLNKGLRLVATPGFEESPLLDYLSPVFGSLQEAAVALIGIGLLVGYFKGRFVLAKTAKKMIGRIRAFEEPVHFYRIYSYKFYFVIGIMILLGLGIKWFGTPDDIRGAVNVIIGAALINGSIHYFKNAFAAKKETA